MSNLYEHTHYIIAYKKNCFSSNIFFFLPQQFNLQFCFNQSFNCEEPKAREVSLNDSSVSLHDVFSDSVMSPEC